MIRARKTLDQVTVTGSRIRGAQIENQQPVQVITRADIEKAAGVDDGGRTDGARVRPTWAD